MKLIFVAVFFGISTLAFSVGTSSGGGGDEGPGIKLRCYPVHRAAGDLFQLSIFQDIDDPEQGARVLYALPMQSGEVPDPILGAWRRAGALLSVKRSLSYSGRSGFVLNYQAEGFLLQIMMEGEKEHILEFPRAVYRGYLSSDRGVLPRTTNDILVGCVVNP